MRKLIIAAAALAFIASPAFAQDKAGDKSGTAATSSDTMSKDTMKKKTTKSKKSAKKTGDDATKQ